MRCHPSRHVYSQSHLRERSGTIPMDVEGELCGGGGSSEPSIYRFPGCGPQEPHPRRSLSVARRHVRTLFPRARGGPSATTEFSTS
jgi:hypothetical protein